MPIYVYKCKNCDHVYEVMKSVQNIDSEERCEKCGHITERTIASSVPFYLNGPDFHNTNYDKYGRKDFTSGKGYKFKQSWREK